LPRFAANLTTLWPELDIYDRFAAAALAGFGQVELIFAHRLDPVRLQDALLLTGQELVLFNARPGQWEAGDRGLLCLRGRENECMASIQEAVSLAARLGTRRVHVLTGVSSDPGSRAAREVAVTNLRQAIPVAESASARLLIEPVSSSEIPGYWASSLELAEELVREMNHPAVRLELDQYQLSLIGTDPVAAVARVIDVLDHVQIADEPGRHEPGTGRADITGFLAELDRLDYSGFVGLEYRPLGSTADSLRWLGSL
jgi:hydroxypyruvate isomerase